MGGIDTSIEVSLAAGSNTIGRSGVTYQVRDLYGRLIKSGEGPLMFDLKSAQTVVVSRGT